MVPHESGTVRSDDVDIYYRRLGRANRRPILIIPGQNHFSYDWLVVAQALGEDHDVVAVDLRGFADSGWSSSHDYSMAANARDFVAVLDHFGWTQTVFIGHSLGSRYAMFCAANYPDRVAAFVSVDIGPETQLDGARRSAKLVGEMPDVFPSLDEAVRYFRGDPDDAATRARFEAYTKPVDGGVADKRDRYFFDRYRADPELHLTELVMTSGPPPAQPIDLWDVLKGVQCPSLWMRGTRSDLCSTDVVTRIEAANPMASTVTLDTGHNIAGDDPEAFVREIRKFLAQVKR